MLTANDVASVIIARNERPWTDAMSLQKLLYYVQAWHLAVTGEPLFREQVKAWRDGPVVPQVWHERKDMSTRSGADQDLDDLDLDDLASDLIDLVLSTYGSMAASELSALTHVEEPWKSARGDLPDDAACREPVSREDMARFYRTERTLGGRTAADLAAGGVPEPSATIREPLDVDALLASLEGTALTDTDAWGGANLADSSQYDNEGIEHQPRRPYVDC